MTNKKEIEKEKETGILSLIETDHREVEELFNQLENSKDPKKSQKLFEQLYQEMALHAYAEEMAFYPAMREYKETKKFLEDAEEEHNSVKILFEEMKSLNPNDAEFEMKFTHLKETPLHHIEDKKNEIFAAVRKSMKEEELQNLSTEFQNAKESWKADVKASLERK